VTRNSQHILGKSVTRLREGSCRYGAESLLCTGPSVRAVSRWEKSAHGDTRLSKWIVADTHSSGMAVLFMLCGDERIDSVEEPAKRLEDTVLVVDELPAPPPTCLGVVCCHALRSLGPAMRKPQNSIQNIQSQRLINTVY
jgi:hypothetical protein